MTFLEYIFCFFFFRWIFPYHPGAPGTRGLDTSAGHGAGSQSFGGPEASLGDLNFHGDLMRISWCSNGFTLWLCQNSY